MNALNKIQIAIAGCGAHSHKHAAAIKTFAELKLVACCDIQPERVKAWSQQYTCTPYTELDEMLAREKIDIIILCTWPNLHLEQIRKSLEAGIKNILCEKALVITSTDAHEVGRLIHEHKAFLMEGSMYRHHPAISKIVELVTDPRMGPIDCIQTVFNNYEPLAHKDMLNSPDWRYRKECAGGVTHDWMNYCVNAANFFSKSKPVRVFASANVNPQYDVIDRIYGQIVYENGINGFIESSKHANCSQLLRISCAQGRVELPIAWGIEGDTTIFKFHRKIKTDDMLTDTYAIEEADVFIRQMDNFLRAMKKEADPVMPLQMSILNIDVTDALIQSVQQQKSIDVNFNI